MKITERIISRLWQSHLVRYPVADTGEWLHIIFPGRASNTSGCDFKDAVFAPNGRIMSGDIEIHVKSSQWYSHGHHRNLKYNNIVLHVVWQRDSQTPALLQNGQTIPTICLGSFINSPLDKLVNLPSNSLSACPASSRYSNIDNLNKLLTAAGKERFAAKIDSFRKSLNTEEAGQVLYRGIARALGYAQNAEPCQELADRLSLNLLQTIKPKADARQALILGTAGLLPSQRHRSVKDRETAKLEKIWQSMSPAEAMNEVDWCFFRVRPDNFPTRRLIALSYLLSRYCRNGLLPEMLQLVNKTPSGTEHRRLENGLAIATQGYWAKHFDLGMAHKRSSALLGREKASAIVINTLLPFAGAWGELSSDLKLKKKAARIYRRYPQTGDNELTRYMKQQLRLHPQARLSACQQQGLLQLFKAYCRCRNCAECPVALNRG